MATSLWNIRSVRVYWAIVAHETSNQRRWRLDVDTLRLLGAAHRLDRDRGHVRGLSVEIELVALDVLHHDARLVVVIGRQ